MACCCARRGVAYRKGALRFFPLPMFLFILSRVALFGLLLVPLAHAQSAPSWVTFTTGRLASLQHDPAADRAVLTTLTDDGVVFHEVRLDGTEADQWLLPVGPVDGVTAYGEDFLVWASPCTGMRCPTDAVLRRVTRDGTEVWSRTFDWLYQDTIYGVSTTAAGNILVRGRQSVGSGPGTGGNGAYGGKLVVIDSSGDVQWGYSGEKYSTFAAFEEDEDGTYTVFGSYVWYYPDDYERHCPFVFRLSDAGQELSYECLVEDAPGYSLAGPVRPSGDYLFALDVDYEWGGLRLLRAAATGDVVSLSSPVPFGFTAEQVTLVEAEENGLWVVASSREETRLIRLDDRGAVVSGESFSLGVEEGVVTRAVRLPDGDLLVAGWGTSESNGKTVYGTFLARVWPGLTTSTKSGPTGEDVSVRAFPNPTRGPVSFRFRVPTAGSGSVTVYDAMGRRVAVLPDRAFGPGETTLSWDALDVSGWRVAPGLYTCVVSYEGGRASANVIVL